MNSTASRTWPHREAIAEAAVRSGCRSVAFTYNDPVIFMEYAVDVAQACRERDIKTVAVSAGYICAEPRLEFFRHMDAANIDLKGFTEGFYKNLCSGRLQPVLETLEYLKHSDRCLVRDHYAVDSRRERLGLPRSVRCATGSSSAWAPTCRCTFPPFTRTGRCWRRRRRRPRRCAWRDASERRSGCATSTLAMSTIPRARVRTVTAARHC